MGMVDRLRDQSGIEGALGVGVRGHGGRCQYSVMALMVGAHHARPQTHVTPVASLPPGAGSQATFTHPFAYCAALGTIDAPDSRYTGPKVPDVVAQGLKKAFGAPAGRATVYEWQCTNGVPEIMRQFAQPDARGFLSHIWYAVSPD
jgi:hypothetical protein